MSHLLSADTEASTGMAQNVVQRFSSLSCSVSSSRMHTLTLSAVSPVLVSPFEARTERMQLARSWLSLMSFTFQPGGVWVPHDSIQTPLQTCCVTSKNCNIPAVRLTSSSP